MLAGDGVAEVIDTMAPRQVRLGRTGAPPYAVRLTATDTRASWVLGPGDPVAALQATAADLLLLLWGRLPADHRSISWHGDREKAQTVLGGSLVPDTSDPASRWRSGCGACCQPAVRPNSGRQASKPLIVTWSPAPLASQSARGRRMCSMTST